MKEYNHKSIEEKWQKQWEEKKVYVTKESKEKEKYYLLVEFPYPSGEGLHVGHVRSYTALDIIARKKRADGKNVLYPIGWDAFGLPTENYAIKTGIHPAIVTKNNTDNFRRQLQSLGFSFDWSREINTTDPKYYKWTQWIFLELFKAGLAYKAKMPINWCLSCKIGLANEEVIDGKCERCEGETEKREKEQWMLAITKYADRLDKDLDDVDYWERIKIQQRNWIGRSEGAEINFNIAGLEQNIPVFTTRPDTIFGATYIVLSPEHALVPTLLAVLENNDEVLQYLEKTKTKTEIERTAEGKGKTGVLLKGIKAINPANNEEIPIFIADYVLAHYGTGAIMAVPAHDERDFLFAEEYHLPIKSVIENSDAVGLPFVGSGLLINSDTFNGLQNEEAKKKITEAIGGKLVTTYKLRDWVFSRQRYWGEPIPMVHCKTCGWVPVAKEDLPIQLPVVEKYQPTDSGLSPLANIKEWVETTCPNCKGFATRETDTMPNWGGSSWYYLRYTDPHNDDAFASKEKLAYWTPVDWYNGGMEHTTLHLLYSRFWHKFLYDIKAVPTHEPYKKRTSHGLIMAENGFKMSKSKGNVINPDDVVKTVGADTLRVYEMFTGPFDQSFAWNTDNMIGSRRFLEKVWRIQGMCTESDISKQLNTLLNQTIKKVGEDIENLKFNTAISQLMILTNELEKNSIVSTGIYKILIKLLSPFAPHMTEELWSMLGEKTSVHEEVWPSYDATFLEDEVVTIAVQVNGKMRGVMTVERTLDEKEIKLKAHAMPSVVRHIKGFAIKKEIYVRGRLLNIVVEGRDLT